MDALALLTADHNRVRGLFARFQEGPRGRGHPGHERAGQDDLHRVGGDTTIEEKILYPTIHDLSDDIAETVDEGVQEHHPVKILMDELHGIGVASDEWTAKMKVLIENVEHHAEEEESELFPDVRAKTDAAAREELGVRLEAKKAELGAPTPEGQDRPVQGDPRRAGPEQAIPGRSTMDKEELAATVAVYVPVTNAIELMISIARDPHGNVKRWRAGQGSSGHSEPDSAETGHSVRTA